MPYHAVPCSSMPFACPLITHRWMLCYCDSPQSDTMLSVTNLPRQFMHPTRDPHFSFHRSHYGQSTVECLSCKAC